MEMLSRSHSAYEHAKLARSQGKSFSRQPNFTAWGVEVCNEPGTVGVASFKRVQTFMLGVLSLCQGSLTKRSWQSLLGLCVYPLMLKKECMCLLGRTYVWLDKQREGVLLAPPSDIADELLSVFVHMFIAYTNIRAQVDTVISCTDATPSRGGTVSAQVSRSFAKGLYEESEYKGQYVRLDWGSSHPLWKKWSHSCPSDDTLALLEGVSWQNVCGFEFKATRHVNIQEALAFRRIVKHTCMDNLDASRRVNGAAAPVAAGS